MKNEFCCKHKICLQGVLIVSFHEKITLHIKLITAREVNLFIFLLALLRGFTMWKILLIKRMEAIFVRYFEVTSFS